MASKDYETLDYYMKRETQPLYRTGGAATQNSPTVSTEEKRSQKGTGAREILDYYMSRDTQPQYRNSVQELGEAEISSIEDWFDQYDRIIQGVTDYDKKRNGGYTLDASGGYGEDIATLIDAYNGIKGYVSSYGIQNPQKYIGNLRTLQKGIEETNQFMSSFDSEDAYNQYVAKQEDYEQKRTANLPELEEEIARLKEQRESAGMYQDIYDDPVSRLHRGLGFGDGWEDIRLKGRDALEEQIRQKQAYLDEARLIQEQEQFSEQLEQWQQAYQGRSYGELKSALDTLDPSGAEYQWLREYAQSAMRPEDYTEQILKNTAELMELEKAYEQMNALRETVNRNRGGQAQIQQFQALRGQYGETSDLKARIEELNAENWKYQNALEYGFLEENEDYAQMSSQVSDRKTAGLGIGLGTNWWGQGDPVYDYINNIDGAREVHPGQKGKTPYAAYDYMTDKEIADYNYLYNAQGQEAAKGYLDYLEYTLNQRQMEQLQENTAAYAQEHPIVSSALSVPTNLVSGIGVLGVAYQNAARKFSGEYKPIDYNSAGMVPTVVTTTTRGTVAQSIADATGTIALDAEEHPVLSRILNGKSLGDVYQLGMSMVDSAANASLAAAGIPGGTALLGGSAASQGVLDALEAGANDSQALAMGILNGTFEMLFEEVSLDKLLKGNAHSVIKGFFEQGFVEGSEEFCTSLANAVADTLVMAEKSDYRTRIAEYVEQGYDEKQATRKTLEDIAIGMGWDFVGGLLSGGIMDTASRPVRNYVQGAQLKNAGVTGDQLAELGRTYDASTKAHKLAEKVDANTGAYTIGRLFGEIGATLTEQNKADIAKSLESKGMTPEIAQKHAEIMEYIVEGGTLSDTQMKMIEGNDILADTLREVVLNTDSTVNRRLSGYNEAVKQVAAGGESASRTEQTPPGQPDAGKTGNDPTRKTTAAEGGHTVSENGKTTRVSTGEEVQIEEIDSLEDGAITFRLKDGSTAQASDIQYASEGEALLYETVAGLGVGTQAANILVGAYRTSQEVSAENYALGIQEAFQYGLWNAPRQDLNNGPFSAGLTEYQRNVAYENGRIVARQRAAQEQASKVKRSGQKEAGKVHYDGNRSVLSERQRTSLSALDTIADVLGVQIYVFESQMDTQGNRVGKNGWYDPGDGSIHIDLFAGSSGQDTVLFTAAHELTHFIRDQSPAKFQALADFLMEQYGEKGVSLQYLMDEQIRKAEQNGRTIDYGTAYEEVVADSMETMLSDGKVVEKLRQRDKSLWEMVKDYLHDLAEKIRKAYAGLRPDSLEGKLVADMKDAVEKMQELFTEGLVDAGENYRGTVAKENAAQVGDVKMQMRSVNGNSIVWIEDNILKENNGEPVHQYIANYIAEHIGEVYTIIESGQKVYIGRDLPGEYTQSKYTQAILRNNSKVLKVKNRAVAGLGEMIEIATNRRWERTKHTHSKDAKYGIYRYDTRFGFPVKNLKGETAGANVYRAELLIRNASDGKKYLYDVVSIRKDIASSDWLTNKAASAAANAAGQMGDVSTTSIPSTQEKVNKKFSDRDPSAARMNQALETEKTDREGGVKIQARLSTYDYSKSFAQQVDDYLSGNIPAYDSLTVGPTPKVFQDIGFNALPMTINTTHVDYAVHGTKDADHYMGATVLKQLPAQIQKPIAVFASQTKNNTSVVALLSFTVNGKQTVAPVMIDGFGRQNGIVIDSNAITSLFGKTNAVSRLLLNAVNDESKGKFSLLYWNKKEATSLLHRAGLQLPGALIPRDGFIHSIRENASPVKPKFENVTESQQFKRWFGDWEKHPKNASKVVNPDGTPKVMYHGTSTANGEFYAFDYSKATKKTGFGLKTLGKGNYFTARDLHGSKRYGGRVIQAYLNIRNPYVYDGGLSFVAHVTNTFGINGEGLSYDAIQKEMRRRGYDGVIQYDENGEVLLAVTFDSEQIKSVTENVGTFDSGNPDIRYSDRDPSVARMNQAHETEKANLKRKSGNAYSYESLISKPDMFVTMVGRNVPKNRADVVHQAKQNAAKIGKFNAKDGKVSVHVMDTDTDVVLSTNGLKHGLDRRFDINAPVTLQAGEIISNSIRINELTPAKSEADSSYILIGAAKAENGDLLVVQSVVNRFSSELESMDVLYAINAKKGNRLRSMRPGFQGPVTDSSISISELLDYVNEYFPDVLPEDVLKHYEHDARPDGKLGESVLYSDRDPSAARMNQALETENAKLREDVTELKKLLKLQRSLTHGTMFTNSSVESMARVLMKDAGAKGTTAELAGLLNDVYTYIAQNEELTWEGVMEKAQPAVDWLQEHMETGQQVELRDMGMVENWYDQSAAAQDLLAQVYDGYWRVSTMRTVADVKQQQIDRLKGEHHARMEKLKATHKEQVAKLKQEHQAELTKVRQEYRENAKARQQEIVQKYQESRAKGVESRNKTAMRHKVQKVVKELNDYLLKGTKDKHVPIELQKAVAEALDAVNMDTVGAEERIAKLEDKLLKAKTAQEAQEISRTIDRVRAMGDSMKERLQALKAGYEEIIHSDDPLVANAYDPGIAAQMMTLMVVVGDTPLRDMSLRQLEAVHDAYTMVLTTVRNANKTFKAARNATVRELGQKVMDEVKAAGGKRQYSTAGMKAIRKFLWNNLKPAYAFEMIGSGTFSEIFKNVRAGEDVWAVDVNEARSFYLETARKYGYNTWNNERWYEFTSASGMDFQLNLEQIMSLYAYSKREQAADHLRKGGIVIDETTEITRKTKLGVKMKFNPTEATTYNISDETLAAIVGKLTPEQRAFVDEMQDYLASAMGEKGNEISLQLYGIKLFKEKNYFPLKSAPQYMARAKEQQQGEVKIKNAGFSKEPVKHASNPVVLTPFMQVWADHVNDMSMYHAFVLPMEDLYRVYNFRTGNSDVTEAQSVNAAIQNAYGKGATEYIDQLLKDLNGGARTDSTTGIINRSMNLFKKGAVFASMSVVIQQPSAIGRALSMIDAKYFAGPKVTKERHGALWEELKRYAPVAAIKEMGYFDTNMGKSTRDYILGQEYDGIGEKAKALFQDSGYRDEALSRGAALADEITWCNIWEAVKRETKAKNPGMDVQSEAFLKQAGERFTDVIVKTQVYDSVLSRSANMRSKDTGMKMATAFMAEPTTSINMVADALLKGKRGDVEGRRYCRRAIGSVVAAQVLNAVLVSFVYAARDDDEDKTYLEKYTGSFVAEVLDGLNPATYIPFAKDIVSIVQGYDVERSDLSVITDLWNAWKQLGSENLSGWRKVENFAGSICQIFGLPLKNILRDVRGMYQVVETFGRDQKTTLAGLRYAAKESLPALLGGGEASDEEQLFRAYQSGDTEHLERVRTRLLEKTDAANDTRAEKEVLSGFKTYLRDQYIAKKVTAQEVTDVLQNYFGMDPDDITSLLNQWQGVVDTGRTASQEEEAYLKQEVSTDAYIEYLTRYSGKSQEDAVTAEKRLRCERDEGIAYGDIKALFLSDELSETKVSEYLQEYGDVSKADAAQTIQEWNFEGKYGIAWKDRKQAYLDDQISRRDLRAALIQVEGKSAEDADAYMDKLDFEKKYGFASEERKSAYLDGTVSRSKLKSILVNDLEYDEAEAELTLSAYDWAKNHPRYDYDTSTIKTYIKPLTDLGYSAEECGIPVETFVKEKKYVASIKSDKDENGDGIPYSRINKAFPYINQLPLTAEQKTAFAVACGWTLKTVTKKKLW